MKRIVVSLVGFCSILAVFAEDNSLASQNNNVKICQENNMAQTLLTTLRDQTTSARDFQDATNKLAPYLVFHASEFLLFQPHTIRTPLALHAGLHVGKAPLLVPILRSGITLLPVFQKYFKDASVGFIGVKRDEETALPLFYYANLPTIQPDDQVIVLEPMLATGGSLSTALSLLKKAGADVKNIVIVSVIGAQEGVNRLQKDFPGIRIVLGALDLQLNETKFIVPGLGDFGDRFFGTVVDATHQQNIVIGAVADSLL